jgi:hypothetical protein
MESGKTYFILLAMEINKSIHYRQKNAKKKKKKTLRYRESGKPALALPLTGCVALTR